MIRGRFLAGGLCSLVGLAFWIAGVMAGPLQAASSPQRGTASSPPSGMAEAEVRDVLDTYCVRCHNDKLKTAGLSLQTRDLGTVGQDAEVWEKVVRKLRGGMMPPPGRPRPERTTYDGVRAWLETALDRDAAGAPNPGRAVALHRLNRTEYKNVIRDLLALDVDVTEFLPPDDSAFGFDNNAGLLKVTQTGMEQYLRAARKISRLAIGASAPPAGSEIFRISPDLPQYEHVEGLPFGTHGGTLIRYTFPLDGEYEFAMMLHCANTRGGDENCADGSSGFPDDQEMVLLIDGDQVQSFEFKSTPRNDRYGSDYGGAHDSRPETERLKVRVPVKAGAHEVGVTFRRLPAVETVQRSYRLPFSKPLLDRGADRAMQITVLHLSEVAISGPFDATGASDTPSRRAVFVCRPTAPSNETACAKTILATLARRAYRRPVTDADVQPLLGFYTQERRGGAGFESGIEFALRALLTSREFWFRVEKDPVNAAPNTVYRISDLDLASRLSFFLWSSIPDEELLTLAAGGKLKDPAVLERQVRRMLADARAAVFTRNFTEQWLTLRQLAVKTPSVADFPDFDQTLRQAFQQETALFVDSIIREDRGALELLDADYTFVNARLARHYGIPNVGGSEFRRVSLSAGNPHRGLLGQGSVLLVTSHPTRTSPVKRGKWILEQILGTPPPPPPPNVPELEEQKPTVTKALTMRERMAEHRANPYCAGCHSMLDPMGFALENFDPIGRFRTVDENFLPIDASGVMPDGTKFQGFADFRAALTAYPDRFLLTLTEKLLTYALGRGMKYDDMPTVRAIVRDAAPSSYRFSSIILGIVKSVPFQMRTAGSSERVLASRQ